MRSQIARGIGMGGHHKPNEGGTNVWLTPRKILSALGPFDLDPCAAPLESNWPTARNHVRLPDDGLAKHWYGRVWLNPPYGKETETWVERLAEHGDGIALIFARTETDCWQRQIFRRAHSVLFLNQRINFHDVNGRRADRNSGAPSALVAYGDLNDLVLLNCGLGGYYIDLKISARELAQDHATSSADGSATPRSGSSAHSGA